MTAVQLRGAPVAARLNERLTEELAELKAHDIFPCRGFRAGRGG